MKDAKNEFNRILDSLNTLLQKHPHLQVDLFLIFANTLEDPEKNFGTLLNTCYGLIDIYELDNRQPKPVRNDIVWDAQYMTLLQEFSKHLQSRKVMKKLEQRYQLSEPEEINVIANRLLDQCQKEKKVYDNIIAILKDPDMSVEDKAKRLINADHGIDHTIYHNILRALLKSASEQLTKADALRLIKIYNEYADSNKIERVDLHSFDTFINMTRRADDYSISKFESKINEINVDVNEHERLAAANHLPTSAVAKILMQITLNVDDFKSSFGPSMDLLSNFDQLLERPLYILRNKIDHDPEITIETVIADIEKILGDSSELSRISATTSVRSVIDPLSLDRVKETLNALMIILHNQHDLIGFELGMMILRSPCTQIFSETKEMTNFSDYQAIFNLLIKNPDDILRAIEAMRTNESVFFESLFQGAMQNVEERKRLFPSHLELLRFVMNCWDKDLFSILVYEIVQDKDERQSLINGYSMLAKIFDRISPNNTLIDYRIIAEEIINDSVSNPDIFTHWFKTPEDYNRAKLDFPDHPVFMLNSLEEAIEYVNHQSQTNDTMEIEKASKVIIEGSMRTGFFKPSREVRTEILKHLNTANSPQSRENASNSAEATVKTRQWEQLLLISPDELRKNLEKSDQKYREDARSTLVKAQSDILESQDKGFPIKEGLSEHIDSLVSELDHFSKNERPLS